MDEKQEKALCVIKPDGVRRHLTHTVMQALLDEGLEIVALYPVTMTQVEAEKLYEAHRGAHYFDGQISFMTSGPSVVVAVEGINCSQRLRHVVKSLRAEFGQSVRENVVHGSDSFEAGIRETEIFFPS